MKLYTLLAILLFSTALLSAQMQATGNNSETETKYTTHPTQDPVFLYSNLSTGGISVSPINPPAVPTYVWYTNTNGVWKEEYSNNSPVYNQDIEEGGYKVEILEGGETGTITETHHCWVFVPVIESVNIDSTSTSCDYVRMKTDIVSKDLTYYDITTSAAINLEYEYTYNWTITPNDDFENVDEPNPALPAPVEKTSYALNLEAFNFYTLNSNTIEIEGIAVEAEYKATVSERDYENEISSSDSYSAPVLVNFEDISKGSIDDREWIYYNTQIEGPEGEIGADYDILKPNYVFSEAGTYNARLSILNRTTGCTDTYSGTEIKVIEMSIEVPNAFTPNDDGTHDIFLVQYKSIEKFRMVILNRWGRKVYETNNPGEGWNGKIKGRKASEGVYFYYITAEGFNKDEKKKLEGAIHLIR